MLLLTVGLILVGFILLALGIVADIYALVYAAIACAMVAGVVLVVYNRLSRRQPAPAPAAGPAPAQSWAPRTQPSEVEPAPSWTPSYSPQPAPEPTATMGAVGSSGPAIETVEPVGAAVAVDEMEFPIADYDELRVSEILPLLPELYLDELEVVREREVAGKRRSAVIDRVDDLMDELEAAEEAPGAEPVPAAASGDGFPIADYERRSVAEIIAMIPDLSDDELDRLAEREERGQNRAAILNAIDDEFEEVEVEEEPAAASSTVKQAPAKKMTAKKVPAKKLPRKKAAAKKAPAKAPAKKVFKQVAPAQDIVLKKKKAPAKKAPAKKLAAKKAPAKKLAAKKAPAKKAPAKKLAAKKAPAKKAPAKKAPAKKAPAKKVGKATKKG